MKIDILLPGLGEDTVSEVNVSQWLAKVGDVVKEGDDLLEITTDKAAFCLPAPQDGTLLELQVHEGDIIHVGDVICTLNV